MNITPSTKLCMIVGSPIKHSLSPVMHNAAFSVTGLDDKYVYVGCDINEKQIDDLIRAVKALRVHGISCTAPLKESIFEYLDTVDPIAEQIGAVNTIVNTDGKLHGYNTDWLGVTKPLYNVFGLNNDQQILLVGAGGAAKAAAYGLANDNYDVTICNRTLDAAQSLGDKYAFKVIAQDNQVSVGNYDVIINTVPSVAHESNSFFDYLGENCRQNQVVFDITYGSSNRFTELAVRNQATVIDGREMLLYQGMEQFHLFTGLHAPEAAMRIAIGLGVTND